MKKIIFIIALFCLAQIKAQNNCTQIESEFFYIEFEIIKKDDYPIYMFGACKQLDSNLFSTKNDTLFVENFYEHALYVPNIILTSNKIIDFCIGVSPINNINKRIRKNLRKIDKKNTSGLLRLEDGSVVKIKICKINGTFLVLDKAYISKFSNSNEYLAETIQNKFCYPFIIKKAEKIDISDILR
jgi:hypothetical protein